MARHSSKPRDIHRATLGNGIRVITEYMPHVRSVSVGIWIGTGSREEGPHETGISHFIEHMVFKGTKNRSAEQIARSVDSIGGGLDAFTSKELVSYNVKVLDEHLPDAFDVVADLVRNPLFQEEDIEKEKGVILEELKMEVDNPEYLIHEIFSSNFWKGHALGRPILGTKQTIRGFDRDKVERYYRQFYTPANILITAAGSLDHDKLVRLVERHFQDLKARAATRLQGPPRAHAPLVFRNKASLEQVHVYIGVPSVAMPDESRFSWLILNAILGGGMSSRLFQNIREKQGLAYTVYSELMMYRDAGCMLIYAGTSIKAAGKVVESIVHELRELSDKRVSEDELRRAKDHLKGSYVLSLESTSSRMGNLARQELYFKKFFSLDEMLESVERVTAEEVQQLAGQYFDPKNMAVAMLGRLEGFRVRREDLVGPAVR
ncbi:MAG TPA: pitrilysin family protein [Bryobacteraceae bacterium]|jgi:predicted Zn-dependent peptidase|nr:pitrilysin family protein [Bryobacteraceae bacterium]